LKTGAYKINLHVFNSGISLVQQFCAILEKQEGGQMSSIGEFVEFKITGDDTDKVQRLHKITKDILRKGGIEAVPDGSIDFNDRSIEYALLADELEEALVNQGPDGIAPAVLNEEQAAALEHARELAEQFTTVTVSEADLKALDAMIKTLRGLIEDETYGVGGDISFIQEMQMCLVLKDSINRTVPDERSVSEIRIGMEQAELLDRVRYLANPKYERQSNGSYDTSQ
jgi:hypothetical protein